MVPWACGFLVLFALPVHGSRHFVSGLMRTSRVPSWRIFVQNLQDLGADIQEAHKVPLSEVMDGSEERNIHLAPETYRIAQRLFKEKLDKDGNGLLSKSEFLNSASEAQFRDPRLLQVGRDIFKYFSSKGEMTQAEFLRLFSVCVVGLEGPGAGNFIFKENLLSDLTAHEKSCLAKLFAVLDDNGDGEVDKLEFDKGYDGELLRQLRKQGYINCGPSSSQLWRADRKFAEFSGGAALNIDRFYELTAEVAGEKPRAKSAAVHLPWPRRLTGLIILAFAM